MLEPVQRTVCGDGALRRASAPARRWAEGGAGGRERGRAKTVREIARRYEEEGLDSALYKRPRPGHKARFGHGPELARISHRQ